MGGSTKGECTVDLLLILVLAGVILWASGHMVVR